MFKSDVALDENQFQHMIRVTENSRLINTQKIIVHQFSRQAEAQQAERSYVEKTKMNYRLIYLRSTKYGSPC